MKSDMNEILRQVLKYTPVLGRESVHILDALKRVLAQDIVVTEDFPAADISAVDGWAVCHDSLRGVAEHSPVHLRVIGEAPAGRPWGARVAEGEAVRIMTGGLMAEGADTVIRLEDASEDSGYVVCKKAPVRGDGIRFQGEHLKKDEVVLRAGDVVGPVEVGVLATVRRPYVFVHQRPLVAIVSTGDELTDFHEPASPWKTMSSNLYALSAQVLETGAVPLPLGIVRDDLDAQKEMLSRALRADLIITSGGLSRGKYDLTQKVFASLGMDMKSSSFSSKPGKPMIFGTIGARLVFGLPGNPSAAMLSFDQFIRPAIFKMMGRRDASSALSDTSNWRSTNGPRSTIDSFSEGHPGNPDGHKASLVPFGRPTPGKGGTKLVPKAVVAK